MKYYLYSGQRCCRLLILAMTLAFSFMLTSSFVIDSPTTPSKWKNLPRSRMMAAAIKDNTIEGLAEDFDRRCAIDATIQALQKQLPRTLTKPLTAITADKVYAKDFRLTVLVPKDNDDEEDEDEEDGEISLLQSRDELVSLSDVLVLATTAAQQASSVLTGGNTAEDMSDVQCQLVVDDSLQAIRIPWKTKVHILGSPTLNRLEGISEFYLGENGKVQTHCIRNVTWNGQAVYGPAIIQALRATQSAVTNLQQSPLFQTFNSGFLWNDLRDGLLEQAATAVARGQVSNKKKQAPPQVYAVESIQQVNTWVDNNTTDNILQSSNIPLPGESDWKDYALAHACLKRFCEQVIPVLSGSLGAAPTTNPTSLFASNVTFSSVDGSLLLSDQESVANFYQSLALARKGTGGSWKLRRCSLLDWKNRSVAIDYEATNTLPRWTIRGRDAYTLSNSVDEERPIVQQIQQLKFAASTPDGSLSFDNKFLMKNLVAAVERGRLTAGSDYFSDLWLQQVGSLSQQAQWPGMPPPTTTKSAVPKQSKLSESAAAKVYYMMSDLHPQVANLWNDTSNRLPPAAEYMTDSVELRGYLGETLLRGANVYSRSIGTILSGVQESIVQKRLVVEEEKTVPPQVALTTTGAVRLSLTWFFRVPPPSAVGAFLLDSPVAAGVPVKFELVSEYVIDADTGLITQHRLLETRINGQLTPADVLSRWIQRFMSPEDSSNSLTKGDDAVLKSFSDAFAWLRSIAEATRTSN